MLKLSLRDLRAHVGRYVLTFLAVTIGVCFVAGVMSLIEYIKSLPTTGQPAAATQAQVTP